jgi:DNA-binding CsgD family transcriptional regulator
LSSLQARLAACTFFLDRSPFPFLLTDTRRRVLYANAAANRITGLKDGIAVTSGQLSAMSLADQAALAKAIEKVDTRGVSLRRIEVQRPSHKPPYRLVLIPVPSSAAMPLGSSQPVAAVLIIDTQAGPELDPDILRVLFSLTPAEALVTAKLGGGRRAEEIAGEMDVSIETVRTHIRHILSKTATGRQGELIALVLRTALFGRR